MEIKPADRILPYLEKLKEIKPGKHIRRWEACCPAHADRDPSLVVAEADDGRVLVKCWAGCAPDDIVAAIGWEMKDLYPKKENYNPLYRDKPRKTDQEKLDDEILLLAKLYGDQGTRLSESDKKRVLEAKLKKMGRAA